MTTDNMESWLMMTPQELTDMKRTQLLQHLGRGQTGTVTLVHINVEDLCLKIGHSYKAKKNFNEEVKVLLDLKAAGGAPCLN